MELNERQMALYEYMVSNKDYPFVSKVRLMIDLDEWYRRSKEKTSPYNSTAYRLLRRDIEEINRSSAQYVILSKKAGKELVGYKLAFNNEEILKKADSLTKRAIRAWIKAAELRRKARNNGQIRMSGSGEKEIHSTVR